MEGLYLGKKAFYLLKFLDKFTVSSELYFYNLNINLNLPVLSSSRATI